MKKIVGFARCTECTWKSVTKKTDLGEVKNILKNKHFEKHPNCPGRIFVLAQIDSFDGVTLFKGYLNLSHSCIMTQSSHIKIKQSFKHYLDLLQFPC